MSKKTPQVKAKQNPILDNPVLPVTIPPKPTIPTIPSPQPSSDEKARVTQAIQSIEQLRQSRVIVYWLTDIAKISSAVILPLYDELCKIGKQPAIDLVLYTRGGDTEVPWRIVSLVREYCERFGVLIPYRAYSSGTLIAMGADEIVMTPLSELGPIDPSRTHPLLPRREGAEEAEPISVGAIRGHHT